MQLRIHSDAEMQALGARLAGVCKTGGFISLQGELGSGKTTLVRGLLHALGHRGAVKSPTFALLEPYSIDAQAVYHFDLYRLADPEELDFLGFRDYFIEDNLCLLEWPERGGYMLPKPDLHLQLSHDGSARDVVIRAESSRGEAMLDRLL